MAKVPALRVKLTISRRCRRLLILVALAVSILAIWHAGQTYFRWDEWRYWTVRRDFLEAGGAKNLVHFFLSPHIGTFSPGIMLLWLPLDTVFGMHSYLPYALPPILLHLVAGFALFEVLVARVRPLVALLSSSLFLVMGNAALGLSTGWMVGYTASLACGFLSLLVISRTGDGEMPLRSALATLGLVMVSLSFSSVGFAVAFMVVMAQVLKRRFALAAVHFLVAGLPYLLWRVAYEPSTLSPQLDRIGSYLDFMWKGLSSASAELLGVPIGSWAALTFAGAILGAVWSFRERADLWVINVASLTSAGFFYFLVTLRSIDLSPLAFAPDQDRYLYVAAALMLPSLAWLVDRLVSLSSRSVIPLVVIAAVAIPLNSLQQLDTYRTADSMGASNRAVIETAASVVGELGQLDAGFLVADRTARFTAEQFGRLVNRGKVPCFADPEQVSDFAQRQALPASSVDRATCE